MPDSNDPRYVRSMGDYASPLPKPRGADEEADEVAKELVQDLLDGAKNDSERGKRIAAEPEHPLIHACLAWKQAIERRNAFAAEAASQKAEKAMQMYRNRPAFKLLFEKLKLNHVIDRENLPWLEKLVKTVREGL